jgi:hypothetical protein
MFAVGSWFKFFRNYLDKDCCDCAWDKLLGENRFKVVMNGEAVLDKETCLVWEKSPVSGPRSWKNAPGFCYTVNVGGRKGWRLPTVEELASLIDPNAIGAPFLPSGHPFIGIKFDDGPAPQINYWTATTDIVDPDVTAWVVDFGAPFVTSDNKVDNNEIWCVRGGQGHDAY